MIETEATHSLGGAIWKEESGVGVGLGGVARLA